MDLVVLQARAQRVELCDEVRDCHLGRVGEGARRSASELVVANYRPVSTQGLERLHEIASETGSAVEKNYWRAATVPDNSIPDSSIRNWKVRFTGKQTVLCGIGACRRRGVRRRRGFFFDARRREKHECCDTELHVTSPIRV